MSKIINKEVSSIQYCFHLTKETALKWDKWEKEFPYSVHEHLNKMFSSFIEYDFDLMFGAKIWITVSDNSELDSIIEFIEQRI